MNLHERRRVDLLARLCVELERRGFPAWACVRRPGQGWSFVWPGGHADADDPPQAAARVAAYLAG